MYHLAVKAAAPILGLLAILSHFSPTWAQSTQQNFEYLSQTLPGRVPEVFGAGLISDAGYRLHGAIVFDPGGGEILWPVIPPAIMYTSLENGIWSEARQVDLPGRGIQAPAFSADGRRLYFQAVSEAGEGGLDIWWAERTGEGWGQPENLGAPVNTAKLESQPSLTAGGVLYFTGELKGSGLDRGIYRSEWVRGAYSAPTLLGGGINSEYIDYCPWIASDETYLLFASSRPSQEERLHIHVSFRLGDGSWSGPQNIHGAIGFSAEARFPSVSPDGRFLFFISGNSAYWVEMAPVLELAPVGWKGGPPRG